MGDVPLRKGASFKKGQLLATIYKDEAELALKARKSKFLNNFTNILPDLNVDFPDDYPTYRKYFNQVDLNKPLPELPVPGNEKLKIFLSSRSILSDYYRITSYNVCYTKLLRRLYNFSEALANNSLSVQSCLSSTRSIFFSASIFRAISSNLGSYNATKASQSAAPLVWNN